MVVSGGLPTVRRSVILTHAIGLWSGLSSLARVFPFYTLKLLSFSVLLDILDQPDTLLENKFALFSPLIGKKKPLTFNTLECLYHYYSLNNPLH